MPTATTSLLLAAGPSHSEAAAAAAAAAAACGLLAVKPIVRLCSVGVPICHGHLLTTQTSMILSLALPSAL
jgi:hypothetical protein